MAELNMSDVQQSLSPIIESLLKKELSSGKYIMVDDLKVTASDANNVTGYLLGDDPSNLKTIINKSGGIPVVTSVVKVYYLGTLTNSWIPHL